MKLGAGFLLVCPSTKKILLALRNDPEPTWANFGGTVERYESPLQCAKRELLEEAGFVEGKDYNVESKLPANISSYINFVYRCYIATTRYEVSPFLNYEHTEYGWYSLDELPTHTHFGLQNILKDEKVLKKIQNLFEKGSVEWEYSPSIQEMPI
jgi:8-oxo-dGTP pyrophosphatase MutT (NUDIX family)